MSTHPEHNHSRCIKDALREAQAICEQKQLRFTPIRRYVLELIWSDHKPTKAYDLLDEVKRTMPSARPPTIYRALDFLLEHGLIHKLSSRNAFIGCSHPGEHHSGYFLICSECGDVQEYENAQLDRAIESSLNAAQFTSRHVTLEVSGVCSSCSR